MKISRVKLYSFPVRGGTEWLVLEISSESNQKGFSELTMSNYSQNNQLQIALNKKFKKLSGIEIYNDDQIYKRAKIQVLSHLVFVNQNKELLLFPAILFNIIKLFYNI